MEVEVVYALPDKQTVVTLAVPSGTTLMQAVVRSGILATYPEIDSATMTVGIFGRRAGFETVLKERDRIEIYRPLAADPKRARIKRARRSLLGRR